MRSIVLALALAALCSCSGPQKAPAPAPAVESAGLAYAQAHCASCHAVRADERYSPNPEATPFATLASTSGMTGYALAAWLRTSHPTMPNIIVEDARIEEVWDYMQTLKE